MVRRTSAARSNNQGGKPKTRKNIELVKSEKSDLMREDHKSVVQQGHPKRQTIKSDSTTTTALLEKPAETQEKAVSASARLAARRQAAQKVRQRGVGSFMTLEDYSYIKRDLITIIVLFTIMMSIIIGLYFVIGG